MWIGLAWIGAGLFLASAIISASANIALLYIFGMIPPWLRFVGDVPFAIAALPKAFDFSSSSGRCSRNCRSALPRAIARAAE
ncbi:MAG TPA: hypothetical protein VJ770_17470 [Stellaceae bacterium]|nr:hypothetical protein [Stellaceae bacterium]